MLNLGDVHHGGWVERILPPDTGRCYEMADRMLAFVPS